MHNSTKIYALFQFLCTSPKIFVHRCALDEKKLCTGGKNCAQCTKKKPGVKYHRRSQEFCQWGDEKLSFHIKRLNTPYAGGGPGAAPQKFFEN